jgi:hypothetical protein
MDGISSPKNIFNVFIIYMTHQHHYYNHHDPHHHRDLEELLIRDERDINRLQRQEELEEASEYVDCKKNTAFGIRALENARHTCAHDNTAVGYQALMSLSNKQNESTAVGSNALMKNNHGENTAVGAWAAAHSCGTANTAVGGWALRFKDGDDNTAVGHRAMAATFSECAPHGRGCGDKNVAVGSNTMRGILDGKNNVAVGYKAGFSIVDESFNTLIGANTDILPCINITHGAAIGADAVVEKSNSIILGRKPTCGAAAIDNVGIGTSTPQVALHVNGGQVARVTLFVSNVSPLIFTYVVRPDDHIILADPADTNIVVTLPPLAPIPPPNGQIFVVKNINTTNANTVTVSGPIIDVTGIVPSIILAAGGDHRMFIFYNGVYHTI